MSLAMIQASLKAPKNQYNKFGGYKYRSLEDILEGVKPLLKEFKYSLIISDEMVQVGDRTYVKACAQILDDKGKEIANGCAYAREESSKKGMDAAQLTGSTSSYARKYCLNGLFAIDDTKDADSMDNRDSVPPRDKPEPKAPPKPKPAKKKSGGAKKPFTIDEAFAMIKALDNLPHARNWWQAHEKEMSDWPKDDVEATRKQWENKGRALSKIYSKKAA